MATEMKKHLELDNIKKGIGKYRKLFAGLSIDPESVKKMTNVTREREKYLREITATAMNEVLSNRSQLPFVYDINPLTRLYKESGPVHVVVYNNTKRTVKAKG